MPKSIKNTILDTTLMNNIKNKHEITSKQTTVAWNWIHNKESQKVFISLTTKYPYYL